MLRLINGMRLVSPVFIFSPNQEKREVGERKARIEFRLDQGAFSGLGLRVSVASRTDGLMTDKWTWSQSRVKWLSTSTTVTSTPSSRLSRRPPGAACRPRIREKNLPLLLSHHTYTTCRSTSFH